MPCPQFPLLSQGNPGGVGWWWLHIWVELVKAVSWKGDQHWQGSAVHSGDIVMSICENVKWSAIILWEGMVAVGEPWGKNDWRRRSQQRSMKNKNNAIPEGPAWFGFSRFNLILLVLVYRLHQVIFVEFICWQFCLCLCSVEGMRKAFCLLFKAKWVTLWIFSAQMCNNDSFQSIVFISRKLLPIIFDVVVLAIQQAKSPKQCIPVHSKHGRQLRKWPFFFGVVWNSFMTHLGTSPFLVLAL